jgi:hypothetical protein
VLKITITETLTEKRWILQGRLVGPWVGELRRSWKKTQRDQSGRTFILDLKDMTFLDKDAEKLLHAMSKKGTQFVADGLYIKHLLEQLKRSSKSELNHEGATL